MQPALDRVIEACRDVVERQRVIDTDWNVLTDEPYETWRLDDPITRIVGLLPRPDNDYNPKAVGVAWPNPTRPTGPKDQWAWIREKNLRLYGGVVRGLHEITGDPVGCWGLLEFRPKWDGERAQSNPDRWHVSGRVDLAWWTDTRLAAIDLARTLNPRRILPFTSHLANLAPEAQQDSAIASAGQVMVGLDIDTGRRLVATYNGQVAAVLSPGPRDFFDRTRLQVIAMGGHATAHAYLHEKSIEVEIEDETPPSAPSYLDEVTAPPFSG